MNAGYFLIQLSSEADKAKVCKEIGETIRKDANGVKQVAFVGVINPLDPRIESPEEVCESLVEASKYIARDQLGATDDCGFSPFSIDVVFLTAGEYFYHCSTHGSTRSGMFGKVVVIP